MTIRNHVFTLAPRLEDALDDEQVALIDGCPRDWEAWPIPDGPRTVGIDGGSVKAQGQQGSFEGIAGRSRRALHRGEEAEAPVSSKCVAFVQPYEAKPTRRRFAVLQSQGHQGHQQIPFLSEGGATVRDLQLSLHPQAEHRLDGLPVTMRLTGMQQTAKSLPETTSDEEMTYEIRAPVSQELERLKWCLWHGNVDHAFQVRQSIEGAREGAVATSEDAPARKLLQAVEEFHPSIENNANFMPNDGARYRNGERLSTGFVESTVHQVISKRMGPKPPRQWSQRGAPLLLQMRPRVWNGAWAATCRTGYPGVRSHAQPVAA